MNFYKRKGIIRLQKNIWHGLPPAMHTSLTRMLTLKDTIVVGNIAYISAEAAFFEPVIEGTLIPIWDLEYNPMNKVITWKKTNERMPATYESYPTSQAPPWNRLGEIWT